jgi:hypothetical protein
LVKTKGIMTTYKRCQQISEPTDPAGSFEIQKMLRLKLKVMAGALNGNHPN